MSHTDSNTSSSARFLVQFHPQNRPYREQCAEQHESVADFDIETANPYLVEMHTSWGFPNILSKQSTVRTSENAQSKSVPVQAASVVGKQKGSSPPGSTKEDKNSHDFKKQENNAKKPAKKKDLLAQHEEIVKKANIVLRRNQVVEDEYRKQQKIYEMNENNAGKHASDFLHGKNPVRANTLTSTTRRSLRRKI